MRMSKHSEVKHNRTGARQNHDRPAAASREHGWALAWLAVAAIVLLGIVAVLAERTSTKGDTTGSAGGAASRGNSAAVRLAQTRPVQIAGASLPDFDSDAKPDPAVGTRAPQLRGASFDGTPVAITADGTPKLVVFVAHWCPHCQREVPVMTRWVKDGGLPAGVELYAVATDTSPDDPNYPPSQWLRRVGWPAPVLADNTRGSAATGYGLSSFPFFVVLDGDGKVLQRRTGELDTSVLNQLAATARTAG